MIVVLDTNVLLISIAPKSVFRPIIDSLINGRFNLVLTNDILSEYTEILERKANAIVANNIAEMLLSLDNLNKVEVYFEWKLIENDPDDNKYVDDAIAGSADFIVSNDQHFNVLKNVDFPKVNVVSIHEFMGLISGKLI
ncbi:putative toxin-antitoxin system toxin component, PIN family [Mucilaginibacter sp. L3T2-6]|uniref:putative toxin-antitoxin system toxin component, PIN family n=1 Tax=Mucilaginibacter sp. L3T2-6 TaxID=3062491 RepID=UPI0026768627|nr:putative toxin-antitoxin system toxin component, PIN family [Mucilaginibacter sp. L3T2-6]MDO3641861.1 putative toxin-antitoxin system toxin component, PIN family [Mucilaginibacter sp. L3T2-6]MDV6214461.1 putative toxin-antitoxin system toxin component, PIN family [Mucilaginibacter sp. L3T2-6]